MTKKVLQESNSDSVKKDPILEAIEAIKTAKRAQLAEDNKPQTEDDVSADNSKIESGKGKYNAPQKHIGDSTAEWVYEEDETKDDADDADDADKDDDKKDDDKSDSDDDKAIKEMSAKISQHLNKLSEEESLEAAIAPELEGQGNKPKEEDGLAPGDDTSSSTSDAPSVEQGSDSKEVKHVAEDNKPQTEDNTGEDNSKIDAGKGKFNNPKALDHSKEPTPESMGEQFVTREDFDLSEDMAAILGDSESLSEEFKTRVETIFEAAVVAKANQVIAEALTIVKEDMTSYRAQLDEQYATKIDQYLNVIVEEWAEENKQALIENTRYDLSQSLMEGMKSLFENHYIEMPKQKVDMFDKLVEENIALEDKINKLITEKVEYTQQLKEVRKNQILGEAVAGLSMSQAEKVKVLAESIDYVTDVDFKVKLNEIKSAYFTNKPKARSIEKDITPIQLTEEVNNNSSMDDEVAGAVQFLNSRI